MELYDQHHEYAAFSVAVGNKSDLASRYLPAYAGSALLNKSRRSYPHCRKTKNSRYQRKMEMEYRIYFTH
jgi:hypothetical protein